MRSAEGTELKADINELESSGLEPGALAMEIARLVEKSDSNSRKPVLIIGDSIGAAAETPPFHSLITF